MVRIVHEAYEKGSGSHLSCRVDACLCRNFGGEKGYRFFSIKDDLVHAGAIYIDAEVVRDGRLITSRKPEDLPSVERSLIP